MLRAIFVEARVRLGEKTGRLRPASSDSSASC
jgi:hypothetical protein